MISLPHLSVESLPASVHRSATGSQARISPNLALEFLPPLTWKTCKSISHPLNKSFTSFKFAPASPYLSKMTLFTAFVHFYNTASCWYNVFFFTLAREVSLPPSSHCPRWNNPTATVYVSETKSIVRKLPLWYLSSPQ